MDEFDLIRRYFAALTPARADVPLGIGDDAALLSPLAGHEIAVSTDTLIAGRHFPLDTTAADVGWKALAVNLSDLAAMGAEPWAFTLALTLPEADPRWLKGFAAGLGALARAADIALIGGDTTRGALSITVTVLGRVPQGQALRRAGAVPGDLLCVTGTLGDAALALRYLQAAAVPPPALRARLDRPTPRWAAGCALRGLAHAAIDVSDGLRGDLQHLLQASAVGADLQLDQLPASPEFLAHLRPEDDRVELQVCGGDDYELCLSLPPAHWAQAVAACAPLPLTLIGRVTEASGLRLRSSTGAIMTRESSAYRHFQ